jgi:nucleolar GTP-binding protein
VRSVATVVVFVIDPSEKCGYSVEEQERLLARWTEELPRLPILAVETKCDLVRRANDRPKVSAVTGEGIPEIEARIREVVRPRGELPPVQEALTEPEIPERETAGSTDSDADNLGPRPATRRRRTGGSG